jgi:hypothetical protein
MKKFLWIVPFFYAAALLLFVLPGCLKDTYRETYKIYIPVYKSLTETRADMKSGPARSLEAPGKLNVFGNYIFLNEQGKGIHVIDNSNPASPKNISFINIPNNFDLAVKGSYLYADSYSDIAVLDISQPANVRAVSFLNNVIKDKNRYWYGTTSHPDSVKVIVDYIERDTTVDPRQYRQWATCRNCLYASFDMRSSFSLSSSTQTGVGGSMARLTIVNDYLYGVSNSDLYAMNISNAASPQLTATRNLGWNIETIYPFKDRLFIGSRTGMFIYSLNNPAQPTQMSQFSHARSCDPVIADDDYAYVTLRTGSSCDGFNNQLDILNIANLSAPSLIRTVKMTNPHGLAKDGDKLFICDGADGLKMYDVSKRTSVELQRHVRGLNTFDVVAMQGNAIVVAEDGLYQYSYNQNGASLAQISKMSIQAKK